MIDLPNPQVLAIAGADAVSFAQAQFCNDLRDLADGQDQWNAWLSPQGRMRFFFHLLRDDGEHLRLLLRGGAAHELRTALTPYVLRAKVTLDVVADARVDGCETTPAADARAIALPGVPPRWLILRQAATSEAGPSPAAAVEQWRLADIRAGLPEIEPNLQDHFLPQWLRLDRLGAISVKKGCYPGQEIMSRLHFKGGNKRSLYRVQLQAAVLPAPGSAVLAGNGDNAGQIVMAAHSEQGVEALASLLDAAAEVPLHTADPTLADVHVVQRF